MIHRRKPAGWFPRRGVDALDPDLVKIYPGPVAALQGVTLEIPQGILGMLDPKGAGKTTLMRMVAGLLEPISGKVLGVESYSGTSP
jgi:ABC-type multidrug transport system ATPase subunit